MTIEIVTIGYFIQDFLGHPFVVAITVFILTNYVIRKIIPGTKEKIITKVLEIKYRFKEIEFVYDRLVNTGRDLKQKREKNEDVKQLEETFATGLEADLYRISHLLNEVIPLTKTRLDSEIEVYFDDPKLLKYHKQYSREFVTLANILLKTLPGHKDSFIKRLSEIEEISFEQLREAEKALIHSIVQGKTIRLRNR